MTDEVVIESLGAGGDGIARLNGKSCYIPFTAPGDRVRLGDIAPRGPGFTAEMVELIAEGPERVKPLCRHFGTCGGCALQHVEGAALARWKRERITECLSMAGIEGVEVLETLTSPISSRRRVDFIAAKRKKGVMIGFHLRRSKQIFDVGECPVLHGDLVALVKPLRALLPELMPRNSTARISATVTEKGPDLLITAPNTLDLTAREKLAAFANEQGLSRLSWQQEGDDLIEPVAARENAEVRMSGTAVIPAPGAFLQATEAGEETLAAAAMEALQGTKNIADLFAGCGSFTFPLAKSARLHAVEGDAALTNALQAAANKAVLPVTTETRDLFRRPLLAAELNAFDGVLFDPPRAGAKAQVEEIAKSSVPTVVAISCNPVSFARDMAILMEGGYKLGPVRPVDQFLFSPHVEMVAALKKD